MCPELAALTEKELMIIILAYDNFSMFRQLNEKERIRKSILYILDDNDPKLLDILENPQPNHRITNAVRIYKMLQRDPKIDLAHKFQEKIDSLQTLLESENGPTGIKNILSSIGELRKNITALENEITDSVIAEGQLKGDQELSLLENWQRNLKNYQAIYSKKPN